MILLLDVIVTAARLAVNGCTVDNIGFMLFIIFTINSRNTVLIFAATLLLVTFLFLMTTWYC